MRWLATQEGAYGSGCQRGGVTDEDAPGDLEVAFDGLSVEQVREVLSEALATHRLVCNFAPGSNPHIHVYVTQESTRVTEKKAITMNGPVGAMAVDGNAVNTGSVTASSASPEQLLQQETKVALHALADDLGRLESTVEEALGQFLRTAARLDVSGKSQQQVREMIEDIWAKDAAKVCKGGALDGTQIAKVLRESGLFGEVLKLVAA